MPKKDQLTKEVMNAPLYQGYTNVPEKQALQIPTARPNNIPVKKGSLGIPEGMTKRARPNYGFNKNK